MFLCLTFPGAASAAEGEGVSKGSKVSPVVVTARSLFADNKKKVVIYKKDVVVKKDDMTLYADEVTIRLKDDVKAGKATAGQTDAIQGSGRIDTIEAKGRVRIIQQDKTATSDEATYYSDGDKIVLTGKPRVWQGENVLNGNKITYNIKEDTFQVEDANTVLYQKGGGLGLPAVREGK
jgi:lipopolysaccharide export system protein LptA